MRSRVHLAGHAVHPMLVVVPAGGVLLAAIFDLVHLATGDVSWWRATRPLLAVTVAAAGIASVPGLVDLALVVPKGRATAVGLAHLGLNLVLILTVGVNAWTRWRAVDPSAADVGWSLASAGILLGSGWLGWTLVQRHHIGVLEVAEGGDSPVLDGRRVDAVGMHNPDEVTATR